MLANLFLSGGGNNKEMHDLDELFFRNVHGRILYIPVGLKRTIMGYEGCYEWFEGLLKVHDCRFPTSMWINLARKAMHLTHSRFDAVYIGGASDTEFLHYLMVKHGIYQPLRDFLRSGGKLYGGSGGATVVGKTINYDQLEKGKLPVTKDAADLLFGWNIRTHANDDGPFAIRGAQPFGRLISLSEDVGLAIDTVNGIASCHGQGKCRLVDGTSIQEYAGGNIFSLSLH